MVQSSELYYYHNQQYHTSLDADPGKLNVRVHFMFKMLISANLGLNLHRVSPSFVQKHFLQ